VRNFKKIKAFCPDEVSRHVSRPRDHVEVDVLEVFELGKARNVLLFATKHVTQGPRGSFENEREVLEFLGRDVMQSLNVTPKYNDEPPE
jgi:hypothetical protein